MKTKALYFSNDKAAGIWLALELHPNGLSFSRPEENLPGQKWISVQNLELEKLPGAQKWKVKIKDRQDSFLIDDKPWILQLSKILPPGKKSQELGLSRFSALVWIFGFLLAFALLGMGLYKGTPVLADWAALSVSQEWEEKLGKELIKQVLQNEKVDTVQTRIIRQLYQSIQGNTTEQNSQKPIEITVVEKDEFNAFAIPGRQIVVYSGAIDKIKSYEELLALLGHEAGHVNERHSIRSLFRSLSVYALVSFFIGDVSGVMAVLIENAQTLQSLSYSRDFERDADLESHKFLCSHQINPTALVGLLENLNHQFGGLENKEYSFFNSHPLTEERIQNAKNQIKAAPCGPFSSSPEMKKLFAELKRDF